MAILQWIGPSRNNVQFVLGSRGICDPKARNDLCVKHVGIIHSSFTEMHQMFRYFVVKTATKNKVVWREALWRKWMPRILIG